MFIRLFSLVLLFAVTACSTVPDSHTSSTSTSTSALGEIENQYSVLSKDLPPFTRVDGKNDVRAGDRVFFEYDSSSISRAGQATLDRQAKWLDEHPNVTINIEGHCDERGTREYNLALGDRRAAAVKQYLISAGINPSRISSISYGKERPAVLGSNTLAYTENRRAVTTLN